MKFISLYLRFSPQINKIDSKHDMMYRRNFKPHEKTQEFTSVQ